MNEDVISIVVDESDRRTVQKIYDAWQRSTGYSIVSLIPESAGLLLALIMVLIIPRIVFAQSAAVSKILDPYYPSSCSSPIALSDAKWGIPLVAVPLPASIIELHPSRTYMGDKVTGNHPLTKMKYGDFLSCYFSGKLSDDESINGLYTQWTSIADTDPSLNKKSNEPGTYITFSGIIYDSRKYTLKQAVKDGSVYRQGNLHLKFVFPRGVNMPCFNQYMDCGGK